MRVISDKAGNRNINIVRGISDKTGNRNINIVRGIYDKAGNRNINIVRGISDKAGNRNNGVNEIFLSLNPPGRTKSFSLILPLTDINSSGSLLGVKAADA